MILFLWLDTPGLRGVMIGRFYFIVVEDGFKRFLTIGFNKKIRKHTDTYA
jgi:hypothetical protein